MTYQKLEKQQGGGIEPNETLADAVIREVGQNYFALKERFKIKRDSSLIQTAR